MISILERGPQIYCVSSHEGPTVAFSSVRKTRKRGPITLCMTWSTLRTTSKHWLITCVVWPLVVRLEPGVACRLRMSTYLATLLTQPQLAAATGDGGFHGGMGGFRGGGGFHGTKPRCGPTRGCSNERWQPAFTVSCYVTPTPQSPCGPLWKWFVFRCSTKALAKKCSRKAVARGDSASGTSLVDHWLLGFETRVSGRARTILTARSKLRPISSLLPTCHDSFAGYFRTLLFR